MGAQVSLLYIDLHSCGYMPKSVTASSYSSSIFSLLKSCYTDFHTNYSDLHSTSSVKGCLCLYALISVCCLVLDDSHSDCGEMESQCSF
jgi:hypothetical protein